MGPPTYGSQKKTSVGARYGNNNARGPPQDTAAASHVRNQQQQVGGGNSGIGQARKVVGQYMLGKAIGEGTFGKVKLAIHLPTGEKVAIKILEKNRIKEQADVRRVNREIKILKKSHHSNVIQLYEVLDTQNSIYLIMENCEGGEMFDYIVSTSTSNSNRSSIHTHHTKQWQATVSNEFVLILNMPCYDI